MAKFIERIYWSDLRNDLQKHISAIKRKTATLPSDLINNINKFCSQGTGFQRTLYHFIQQVFDNQSKQESSRDLYYEFVDNIILICGYLDENYLNKYPKNKGTIKSVKDMAEWYWIGD